jgi:hypothetical protein
MQSKDTGCCTWDTLSNIFQNKKYFNILVNKHFPFNFFSYDISSVFPTESKLQASGNK